MTQPHSLDAGSVDAVHPTGPRGRTPKVLTFSRPDPTPLLPRIAAGDADAVREVVATYGGLLLALAKRWSPDAADAEDAVQEICFDLWRSAHRFDPARASERGFIAMVARRRLIDRMRRRSRSLALEPLPEEFDLAIEDGDEPAERTAAALDAREALEQLTPMQRRCLELHLLDGRTHDEVAQAVALPLGTVKSHIRRGLLRARALLTGRGGEGTRG